MKDSKWTLDDHLALVKAAGKSWFKLIGLDLPRYRINLSKYLLIHGSDVKQIEGRPWGAARSAAFLAWIRQAGPGALILLFRAIVKDKQPGNIVSVLNQLENPALAEKAAKIIGLRDYVHEYNPSERPSLAIPNWLTSRSAILPGTKIEVPKSDLYKLMTSSKVIGDLPGIAKIFPELTSRDILTREQRQLIQHERTTIDGWKVFFGFIESANKWDDLAAACNIYDEGTEMKTLGTKLRSALGRIVQEGATTGAGSVPATELLKSKQKAEKLQSERDQLKEEKSKLESENEKHQERTEQLTAQIKKIERVMQALQLQTQTEASQKAVKKRDMTTPPQFARQDSRPQEKDQKLKQEDAQIKEPEEKLRNLTVGKMTAASLQKELEITQKAFKDLKQQVECPICSRDLTESTMETGHAVTMMRAGCGHLCCSECVAHQRQLRRDCANCREQGAYQEASKIFNFPAPPANPFLTKEH